MKIIIEPGDGEETEVVIRGRSRSEEVRQILELLAGTLRQVLVWLAASAVFTVITQVMRMEFGNLLIRTVIHFSLCFILAVSVGSYLGYSADWISSARVMLPGFLVIYVIIYTAVFMVRLAEMKELNKRLKA